MPDLGPSELIIVLVIALLVFGGSRVADLGGSLGKGIREFKRGISDDDKTADTDAAATPPASPAAIAPTPAPLAPLPSVVIVAQTHPEPVEGPTCPACGTPNEPAARFCSHCGTAMTMPAAAPTSTT